MIANPNYDSLWSMSSDHMHFVIAVSLKRNNELKIALVWIRFSLFPHIIGSRFAEVQSPNGHFRHLVSRNFNSEDQDTTFSHLSLSTLKTYREYKYVTGNSSLLHLEETTPSCHTINLQEIWNIKWKCIQQTLVIFIAGNLCSLFPDKIPLLLLAIFTQFTISLCVFL